MKTINKSIYFFLTLFVGLSSCQPSRTLVRGGHAIEQHDNIIRILNSERINIYIYPDTLRLDTPSPTILR